MIRKNVAIKFARMMKSEPVALKNGFQIPVDMIDFLTYVLEEVRENKPEDFIIIQELMKKKELNQREREDLIIIIFGEQGVNIVYPRGGFNSFSEKMAKIFCCFFNDDGEIVDPRK